MAELRRGGRTYAEIADDVGRSISSVSYLLGRAGLVRNRSVSRLTKSQVDELARLREAGWSYPRLAKKFGVTPGAVHYRCLTEGALSPRSSKLGQTDAGRAIKGFNGRCRRFSAEDDQHLLRLARSDVKPHRIAQIMGRAASSVRIRLLTLALADELRERAAS